MKQRGVNRVVMAHWDFEAAKTFYEDVMGATFEKENDDGEAAKFGVRVGALLLVITKHPGDD